MLVLDERAKADLRETYHWHEDQQVGLGDRFFAAFDEECRRIKETPTLFGLAGRDVRFKLIERFPYVIYYRSEGQTIVILPIVHGHREDQVWRTRV